MHSLGLVWAKKGQKFAHHENDLFGKKLSTMVFIRIKSESAHRVILRKNVDLCMKNDIEIYHSQTCIANHRWLIFHLLRHIIFSEANHYFD